MVMHRNLNGQQFGGEDEQRTFEVHDNMLHVGGRPYPLARVQMGEPMEHGTMAHISVPTESGWALQAHLLYDPEGRPRGDSGHGLGPVAAVHRPSQERGTHVPHEWPEEFQPTMADGKRDWVTLHSPEEFQSAVRHVGSLPSPGRQ